MLAVTVVTVVTVVNVVIVIVTTTTACGGEAKLVTTLVALVRGQRGQRGRGNGPPVLLVMLRVMQPGWRGQRRAVPLRMLPLPPLLPRPGPRPCPASPSP